MLNYTPAQTAKSWVALIGSAISVAVFGLQQSMQFLPSNWALTANAALGVSPPSRCSSFRTRRRRSPPPHLPTDRPPTG